jgi:hypothetical protein
MSVAKSVRRRAVTPVRATYHRSPRAASRRPAPVDILPALKREDSNAGQRAGPTSPLATSRPPNGVQQGDTGFVRDTSAPRGMWRIRRPFGRGIRLHRASRSSRRDGGDAPSRRFPRVRARAVPSACLPFAPRWAGTRGRGSLFACRVTTASETPSRERCGGLRRPGGPQPNRQFLPVALGYIYAVKAVNSDGCGPVVGFIPAVNGEAFSSNSRNAWDYCTLGTIFIPHGHSV